MKRRNQRGFSMIEILVAFVIAAIGLLGLAAMQMISIKNVNNTQFRTLATMYTYDMAERIRSNKAFAAQYVGIDTSNGTPCSGCSTIASADAVAWKNTLEQAANAGGLPNAVGTITQSGDVYSVTITWSEQTRNTAGGTVDNNQNFTLSVRM